MEFEIKKQPSKEVQVIYSETWTHHEDIVGVNGILMETIEEFVEEDEEIINIESKQIHGLSRFWIYTIKK